MQSLKWLGSEARRWLAREQVYPAICCDGLDRPLWGKRFNALTVRYGPGATKHLAKVVGLERRAAACLLRAQLGHCDFMLRALAARKMRRERKPPCRSAVRETVISAACSGMSG